MSVFGELKSTEWKIHLIWMPEMKIEKLVNLKYEDLNR